MEPSGESGVASSRVGAPSRMTSPAHISAQQLKWDFRFLSVARLISSWSKDPSTKTGAVIVAADRRIISTGYNGFPRGVLDHEARYANREEKYKIVVHCERNAMLFCRESLAGATLYTWPFLSCSQCAGMLIQSGIARHVAPRSENERWSEHVQMTLQLLAEAGVGLDLLEYPTT